MADLSISPIKKAFSVTPCDQEMVLLGVKQHMENDKYQQSYLR